MTTFSVDQSAFPLREATQIVFKLSELIRKRSAVEIIFHPGVDPDAESAVRLTRMLCLHLGSEEPRIFNLGASPATLTTLKPELTVEGLKDSALIDPSRREDTVCIVVDVSNMKFAAGEFHRQSSKPDFIFDHHDRRTVSTASGTLILPSMGCASLIVDRLLSLCLGHSSFYQERPKLSALVSAAVLTDLDLAIDEPKPPHFSDLIWQRFIEIKNLSDYAILDEIVDGPWRTPEYQAAERSTLDNLTFVEFGDFSIVFAYMGILSNPDQRPWLAHLASLLIKDGSSSIIGDDLKRPQAAFVLAGVRSPFSLACSLRTDGLINASELINLVEPKSGGGRERAAGAVIHPKTWGIRIWSAERTLETWSRRRIEAWIRKIKTASHIRNMEFNLPPPAIGGIAPEEHHA
jgi:hypothetical protein